MARLTGRGKGILAAAGVLVVAATAGLGYFFWYVPNQVARPLQNVAENAAFPLYQPSTLPSGYAIDETSVSLTSQALLFSASNGKGEKLVFTETPVSQGFDFESFYKEQFVGSQDADSLYGRGKVGMIGDMMSGSLATDSTLVIVKGPKNLAASEMKTIISGLRPIR